MYLREIHPTHVEVLADRNINPYLSHNLRQCIKDDYHNKPQVCREAGAKDFC